MFSHVNTRLMNHLEELTSIMKSDLVIYLHLLESNIIDIYLLYEKKHKSVGVDILIRLFHNALTLFTWNFKFSGRPTGV